MAIKVAPRPNLRTWDRLYFPAIFRGLFMTFRYMLRKKYTMQFPEVKWKFPWKYRGFPQLVMGDNGIEKCVACKLCEVVCPPLAITINIGDYPDPDKRERVPAEFIIDMGRCIVCGLCEEACPKDAIYLSQTFAQSNYDRKGFIYKKEDLLIPNPKEDPDGYRRALGEKAVKL